MKKEKDEGRKPERIIKTVFLIIGMLIAAFGGYWGGIRADQKETNAKVEKLVPAAA